MLSMAYMRKVNRCLTVVLAISFFCLCTIFFTNPPSNSDHGKPYDFSTLNGTRHAPLEAPSVPVNLSQLNNPSQWRELFNVPPEYKDIVESIEYLNYHHEILNERRFGSVNQSTFIIAIQVHKRLDYLKYLIGTLRNVRGIENALVVFSHDLNSEPINAAIKEIDFCRVIQLFFPYSIQIFANTFPGTHPNDCPPNVNSKEAKILKCQNWQFPDKYGHYRIAGLTQIKHHWWWKAGMIFDGIMKRYGLDVYTIFLEEDHYVAPDLLYILKILIDKKETFCENCKILALGLYLKNYNTYRNDINRVGVHNWFSSKHNMGMSFNSSVWNEIRECSKLFCEYDDYNWDWSMLRVSVNCMKEKLRVLTLKAPRVIHVGECGVHTHHCDSHKATAAASALFEQNADVFFPESLVVTEVSKRMLKPSKPNGGWGDPRDQQLCLMNSYPFKNGTFLPETLLNNSSILLPFDRGFNQTTEQ